MQGISGTIAVAVLTAGTAVDLGDGNFAWKNADGTWRSVQPGGAIETRPGTTAPGPWETYRRNASGELAIYCPDGQIGYVYLIAPELPNA